MQSFCFINLLQNQQSILQLFRKMSKLQIGDLLSTINAFKTQEQNKNTKQISKPSKAIEEFLVQGNMKVKKIKKNQQIQMKRKFNYQATQEDMDKWLGIVKLNRQKQTLDLTKKQKDAVKINFFPSKPVSQLQAKTDKILAELNMKNQTDVIKAQEKQLNKLDPQQAKKRLIEARKHRTMVFYQEIKRRRISKIKSKLYHKIKKRQKLREEQKHIQTMTPVQKSQYLQKLTKNRIKQRINLRHNSKNKHIQHLLRFNKYNKDSVQQAINEVNQIRQKQLQRNKIDEQILGNLSEEYDDENYRQQAIMDLQKQLQQMENQSNNQDQQRNATGLDGMKFMKVAKQKKNQKDIEDAYKLLNQLQNQDSENMVIDSDDQEQNHKQKGKNITNNQKNNQENITRKTYGQNINDKHKSINESVHKKQLIKKNINQVLSSHDNTDQLIKGINVQNLKDKYQSQRANLKLNEQLLRMNKDIFNQQNQQNQAAIENLREFHEDKYQNYEQDIQPQKKNPKGWGNWAGPNIKQKKVDPQVQIKKKLAKIQEIKRKRKDGELSNVIINEVRNKNLKDYMVRKLPHQFGTVQQFEYLNKSQIGPEWNSLNQFKSNIKPKVITKVGQIIQPIKMPKKVFKV